MHGDLKASNVLLDHNDKAFVTDFGLAQVMGSRWGSRGRTEIDLANPALNETDGGGLSCQTDLEAFGCLCYHMLTGRKPESGYALVRALNPQVSESLAAFVERLMAAEPQDGFPSYVAVRAELDRMEHQPKQAPPVRHTGLREIGAALVTFALVLVALGAVVFAHH